MTEFERRVLTSKKAGRSFMDKYLKQVCSILLFVIMIVLPSYLQVAIVRKSYQGAHSLEVDIYLIMKMLSRD